MDESEFSRCAWGVVSWELMRALFLLASSVAMSFVPSRQRSNPIASSLLCAHGQLCAGPLRHSLVWRQAEPSFLSFTELSEK
jgi:hypothetical protein